MEEKNIRNISIICSVVGLIVLYYISRVMELPITGIGQIIVDNIGNNVKVCGEVTSKSVSKGRHVFLELNDGTGSIDVVAFNTSAEDLDAYDVEKYDNVCVIGQVNEYNDRLEVVLREKIEKSG